MQKRVRRSYFNLLPSHWKDSRVYVFEGEREGEGSGSYNVMPLLPGWCREGVKSSVQERERERERGRKNINIIEAKVKGVRKEEEERTKEEEELFEAEMVWEHHRHHHHCRLLIWKSSSRSKASITQAQHIETLSTLALSACLVQRQKILRSAFQSNRFSRYLTDINGVHFALFCFFFFLVLSARLFTVLHSFASLSCVRWIHTQCMYVCVCYFGEWLLLSKVLFTALLFVQKTLFKDEEVKREERGAR